MALGRSQPRRWTPKRAQAWLVIMVKVPEIGRVKTRLGRDIGPVHATRFYRGAASGLIRRLAGDTRWRTVLAVAPDVGIETRAFPCRTLRMQQGGGNLGDRLATIVCALLPGPVAIIGTDIPGIRPQHVDAAFRQARRLGVTFGPAPDGGYWLVGFRQTPRRLTPFGQVRWSTEHALDDTIGNLPAAIQQAFARVEKLPELDDVDDGAAYQRVASWTGRLICPVTAG